MAKEREKGQPAEVPVEAADYYWTSASLHVIFCFKEDCAVCAAIDARIKASEDAKGANSQ